MVGSMPINFRKKKQKKSRFWPFLKRIIKIRSQRKRELILFIKIWEIDIVQNLFELSKLWLRIIFPKIKLSNVNGG
jgi:hypothetical protein